ncbi:MAG: hypothetical protein BAJATHORv1_10370 [Candidatus Thorarchaeota archaeon]|nr:MAG: hypothetical protein BAJATHORv1_10370 [Candidatus Thorarchaeota archaeon]
MSNDLERALSKLRFDDQVLGYSLMTKAGRPFVSFAFPENLFPRVKNSIKLYKADLRLMTIDTEKGLVVLAPVDDNWILTVLYVPELQLGLAIAKTKNVLRLLEGIELPPPPDEFEEASEDNLQVLESIAIKAASTDAETTPDTTPAVPEPEEEEEVELTPENFEVQPSTIPKRGEKYSTCLSLDSDLYKEMKKLYRNFGFDVLMLVDEKRSVSAIADSMFQPNERVVELLKWAASKQIVDVPVSESEGGTSASGKLGRFVQVPKFEGDMSKVDESDHPVIKLCDGTRTTEQVAKEASLPKSKVIQIIARYRRHGLKMIGKTI